MKKYLAILFITLISAGTFAQTDTLKIRELQEIAHVQNCLERLNSAINICKERNAKVLLLENRRYDIFPDNAPERELFISNTSSESECPSKIKTIGLLLENVDGLTIDGNGALLLFHDKMTMMAILECKNITVKNITFDYARPAMSEMTIVENDSTGTTVRIHPDSRYTIDKDGHLTFSDRNWKLERPHCLVYDPETEHTTFSTAWKTFSNAGAIDSGDNCVRFLHGKGERFKEGTVITVRGLTRDQVGTFICGSDNIVFSDVNFRYMHALGIVSQRSRNISMNRVECRPDSLSGRIMASSADFMHFSGCVGDININNCIFSGAHDDAINIHGTNLKVTEIFDSHRLKVRFMHPQSYGFIALEEDDSVAFVNSSTMLRLAGNRVNKVNVLSEREIELCMEYPLDKNVVPEEFCIENITWNPNVEIKGCYFTHTNTRGILVTTPGKVLISDNIFYKTGMSAILIEADAGGWYESGPVSDVTIRNNTFIDCGYQGGPAYAVIALHPSNSIIDESHPVHENVNITHNDFFTFGNPVLYAKSVSPLTFRDNRIEIRYPDLRVLRKNNKRVTDRSDEILSGTPFVIIGCRDAHIDRYFINPNYTLLFDSPAKIWEETLPLGNGRLGMMPDGGIEKETIVLNDITMWSGSEQDYSNKEAAEWLPEIRRLLIAGRNVEAQELMYSHFVPKKPENGGTYGCYQLLGDLNIDYRYGILNPEPVDYSRSLDLLTGVAETRFTLPDGVEYTRTYAVPRDGDGILIKFSASLSGKLDFSFKLSRPERYVTEISDGKIIMTGTLDGGKEETPGVRYAAVTGAKLIGDKGSIKIHEGQIVVEEADEAWIALSAATSFLYGDDFIGEATAMFEKLMENPLSHYEEGIRQHYTLMSRNTLDFPVTRASYMPTPERLKNFTGSDDDISLASLYYNYGRYLLISSTRENLLPPNLQGLWTNSISTPWNGDYHTNINVQMNHWPVETGNLPELHMPLVNLTLRAVPSGERTAKSFYGEQAEGWVMHMMTNVWNYTEPGEHPSWGATNTGGAWLCRHLWDHYLFNGDKEYLTGIYPAMKDAARFFLSTMIEEPRHDRLVTAPSSSPENTFYMMTPEGKKKVAVCLGPAMDTQIIGELWQNVIDAAGELGVDSMFTDSLARAMAKLPPMQIDSEGRLMEWLEEYEEVDRHHRHVSHLYGLYPGTSISFEKDSILAMAAKKSLDARGDEGTGWSRAWKVNFHARLHDGQRAWKIFKGLLSPAVNPDAGRRLPGTFPNLFCSHPPFQIDGNFGGTAGITEMIMQSHNGFIDILPAIPAALSRGYMKGLKAQGGVMLDIFWDEGTPQFIRVTGGHKSPVKLRLPEATAINPEISRYLVKENNGQMYLEIPLKENEEKILNFPSI